MKKLKDLQVLIYQAIDEMDTTAHEKCMIQFAFIQAFYIADSLMESKRSNSGTDTSSK